MFKPLDDGHPFDIPLAEIDRGGFTADRDIGISIVEDPVGLPDDYACAGCRDAKGWMIYTTNPIGESV